MKKSRSLAAALLLSAASVCASAATPLTRPTAAEAEPAAHTPTVKETLAAVGQISHELKLIDGRLVRMEESLAGVDTSLKPVGAVLQPANLRELIRELILLAAACVAGLIVLHALLRRWVLRAAAGTTVEREP